MASISHAANGTRSIHFRDPSNKKMRAIRLGHVTQKEAESFKHRLERLIFSRTAGTAPEPDIAKWVAELDSRIAVLLAKWEFIAPRLDISSPNLISFVDDYIKSRTDTKPRTRLNHLQARGFLADYFPASKRLVDVTPLDAKQFRNKMVSDGHAENYIRTQCKNIKMFFGAAVEGRLISENPFKGIPCKVQSVPERMKFITADDIALILEQAPDIEWRLVITLARWGGLRIPSEIAELKWDHVNWGTNRMTIPQPKLSHIPGKGQRVIPIFPELYPILREAFENAPERAVYIVPRLRGDSKNLRTTFNKLVTRAGLNPWTRPFANLRSTRATELGEKFPLRTVAEWMGHDAQVSLNHYQQVREEYWERAINEPTAHPKEALRNALRVGAPESTIIQSGKTGSISHFVTIQDLAKSCEPVQKCTVPPRGLETIDANTDSIKGLCVPRETDVAQCAAPDSLDLDLIVSAWPKLPESVRLAIFELIRSAQSAE